MTSDAARLVDAVCAVAGTRGYRVFLVGGPARDLLLGRRLRDVDLAVEGSAGSVAADVPDVIPGVEVVKRSAFGTVTLYFSGAWIDIASTRSEFYRRPGALPTVRPARIDADLRRRDFTVNAMALELAGSDRGRLIDPAGGARDLRARVIRVLHDGSFRDDATRILRAVRLEQRLGFTIEPHTLALMRRDAGYLATISGARIRAELLRVLGEPRSARILLRLDDLGILRAIHTVLAFSPRQARALAWLEREAARPAALWHLGWNAAEKDVAALVTRLALTRGEARALMSFVRLREMEDAIKKARRPSEVDNLLSSSPVVALYAFAAMTQSRPVRGRVVDYLRVLRHVRPRLRGDDLLALGVQPGLEVGQMLHRIRAGRLDGEIRARRREEEAFVRRCLESSVEAR